MKTIRLVAEMPNSYVAGLAGRFIGEEHFDRLIDSDCDVLKPDGSPLILLRRRVIPADVCMAAYNSLNTVPEQYHNTNRGIAAGIAEAQKMTHIENRPIVKGKGSRFRAMRQDGTVSNTQYAPPAPSGVAGYFERVARYPYCRQTTFPAHYAEKWEAAMPYMRGVSEHFRRTMPERWARQQAMIAATNPDFYIKGTVFTTVTVNKNWRTAVHTDKGDLKAGFGVMSVVQAGDYEGCYFIIPKYRVAVDMRHGDVMLADVHEFHGNSEIKSKTPGSVRLSFVFYYRAKMFECGSAAEELERAKNRQRGTPLHKTPGGKL